MFLCFKNTVKYSNSGKYFTFFVNLNKLSLSKQLQFGKIQRSRIIGGTQIITNKRNKHIIDKIIHFSMQFSAILNIFIVKT